MKHLRALLPHFRREWPWLLIGLGCAALSTLCAMALAVAAGAMLARFGATHLLVTTAALAGLLRLLGLGRIILRYLERLTLHSLTFRTLARLRLWFFRAAVPLAPAGLGLLRGGDLLDRALSDIAVLDGAVLRLLAPLMLAVLALFGFIAFAGWFSPWLGLGLGAALLSGAALSLAVSLKGRTAGQQVMQAQNELRLHVMDSLAGMAELTAFNADGPQARKIIDTTATLTAFQLDEKAALRHGNFVLQLTLGAALLIVLAFPGTPGLILLLPLLALGEIFGALPAMALHLGRMEQAAARLIAIANQPPPVAEPAVPQPLPADLTLCFEQVDLNYGTRPALREVSFTLEPGTTSMVTGPSGAGKSSLVHLLLRFQEVSAGRITCGGVDIRALSGDELRRRMALLSQATRLISGTVRDNLRLARPDLPDADLWTVLEQAELAETVRALPQGPDTWIGENGLQFSGGQARRLALAQMLLKDAPIWLLDEPTEGLDEATARTLLTTLKTAGTGKTILFITHQPVWGPVLGVTQHLRLAHGRLI